MKTKLLFPILSLALLCSSCAFSQGFTQFTTQGTAFNTAISMAAIPPSSRNGGIPVVTYLNVSANAASTNPITLNSYTTKNETYVNGTNSSVNIPVASTNGFTSLGLYVIVHNRLGPRQSCESGYIVSWNGSYMVASAVPANTVLPGDKVYVMQLASSIPLASSATPQEFNGPMLTGEAGKPLLIVAASAQPGTNTINQVNAIYTK